jgi:hypothetical protein
LHEALSDARIEPADFDLATLSAARAANQRDAIVASSEGSCVDTLVVIDDLPVYARSVMAMPGTAAAAEDLLLAEISRCVSTAEEQRPATRESAPPPIYLCGSAARSSSLAERVRARTGRRPSSVNPPLFVPADLRAAEYAAAIGMAIKEQ